MIFELAGIAGVEPWRFTLRQLLWMADARSEAAWDHTSSLIAHLWNIKRSDSKRSSALQPSEFNPYAKRRSRQTPAPVVPISVLKIFMPNAKTAKGKQPTSSARKRRK